jgi:thiol:disulfide interchange protein DsbD
MILFAALALALHNAPLPLGTGHVQAVLVAEHASAVPGKDILLGVRLRMEPQWHVYWRNPGDAGFAFAARWTTVEGARIDSLSWPVPDSIPVEPLMTYGYHDSVLLPFTAHLLPGAKAVHLRAQAKWLECKEVCVPGKADLALDLPVGATPGPDTVSALFASARASMPGVPAGWKARAARTDSGIVLLLTGAGTTPKAARFYPADPGVVDNAPSQVVEPIADGFRLRMRRDPFQRLTPDTLRGILVRDGEWPGGAKGWEIRVPLALAQVQDTARIAAGASSPGPGGGGAGLVVALVLAFAGGILLNLMPCVLPVLSLKAFSLLAGREERPLVHGLAYAAGTVASFLGLAVALLVVRGGGEALGWGFQMQSPRMVGALSVLMALVAFSLWGVFEPGTSLAGLASNSVRGLGGSFLTGVLATVVATPCTAPFMGSAMGWALVQPAPSVLAVFSSLGLGLSAPYVLISGIPALGRFLPRPGAWMETVKQFLGFPLAATAVWLAWVAGRLAGADATATVGLLWVFAGLGAWILGRGALPHKSAWSRNLSRLAFLVLAGGSIAFAAARLPSRASLAAASTTSTEIFREGTLSDLRASAKPWFLVFSADWCLSCQVNERTSIEIPSVQEALRARNVRVVHADWTTRDTSIGKALESYGRQGVPLYVLSDGRTERILPEILTPSIVLAALDSVAPRP